MTLYADLNSKVGSVKVFRCPMCRDGEVRTERDRIDARLVSLQCRIETLPDALASALGVKLLEERGFLKEKILEHFK